MDRNLSLILLVAAAVFLPMMLCQKPGEKGPVREAAPVVRTVDRDPAHKVFPVGEAPREKYVLETPEMRVVFNSVGGTIKDIYLKKFVKRAGQDPENPANWVTLIDHRVYQALDREGRDQGTYIFSFALEDPLGKFNLYSMEGGKARAVEPQQVPWFRENFSEKGVRGVRYKLPLSSGLTLVKEFRFLPGSYHFFLKLTLENDGFDLKGRTLNWPLTLTGASVVPSEPFMQGPDYTILDYYGPPRVIAQRKERVQGGEDKFLSADLVMADGKPNPPMGQRVVASVAGSFNQYIDFAGSYHKFFACLMTPLGREGRDAVKDVSAFKVPLLYPGMEGLKLKAKPWGQILPRFGLTLRVPEQGKKSEVEFQVYAGPKDVTLWERVPAYKDYYEVYRADLDRQNCFCTIPGVGFFGRLLLTLLRFFHSIAANWGVAIILLTVMVRLLLVPLNFKSQYEMAHYQKRMSKVKPLMDEIRKKYAKNKQKMNQELMKLQKKHKLTPPLMGCLPMFITIPVFFGLFIALRVSFDLRQQPFILWIKDLSMPDMLLRLQEGAVGWADKLIPDYLNVLPILMTLLWWLQQKLMPKSDDPQQKQMQVMMQFMPILFGFMLYNYASGLALYMTVSSLFGIFEARLIKKKVQELSQAESLAPARK